MDVFLLTSRFEGMPRAVLQAMAAGVPVVATAVDGTPEVVAHAVTGLLVPPGAPEQAARAVLALAGDGGLRERCIAQAARVVEGRYEIGRMLREIERLYLRLLEARLAPRSPGDR
jgi:glycosyltransferase involved in cell wall biosynthesis